MAYFYVPPPPGLGIPPPPGILPPNSGASQAVQSAIQARGPIIVSPPPASGRAIDQASSPIRPQTTTTQPRVDGPLPLRPISQVHLEPERNLTEQGHKRSVAVDDDSDKEYIFVKMNF